MDTKVSVTVGGETFENVNLEKAGEMIHAEARRKLEGKGTPMAERGNEEMFSESEAGAETAQTVAAGHLRSFVERVERLNEDKQAIADDIKEVYAEMKAHGFDTKAVRTIVRLRKKDAAERQEDETVLGLYKSALGMV